MSDMSDDDSVEFMGTVPAEAAASPVSTAPAPKPEKRKLLKTKAKAGAGKTKTPPAKPKKTLGDDKPKGKAKATKAKATGLVKEKAALKPKRVVKKKASAPAPLRPTGMLSVLDLCSTADDGEETEDEDLRSQSSGSFGGPHVSNGDYDVAMSSADEDSASVVDSDNGSIRTPPRKRVKKAGKAPAPGNDTGDEDDTVDEGWSDHNRWYCNICKDGGELLCCDRCPRAFHMSCLGMPDTSIPDTEWYCKMCTECLDRRRVKKENREKARLEREAAKLERDANKRKMQQMKEDIIAQKNAEAIENKAKRVLEMQDRILSRKKIKYKDKEEEKLGRLAEDLAQTVRVAKDKLEKLEKEDAALRKKEEAFNKKKRGGGEEHGVDEDATTTKSDKPTPAACVYGNVASDFTGDLLAVWDCLNSFSSIVEIAPFTLDQLAAALTHSETAPLITEIHMCLLNVILEDREEEDYVSDDEASMDEAERFRYEIQHAPVTIGVPTSNLLNSVSWPSVLFNLTMAVPRYSSSLTDDLKEALDALNEKEYPSLLLRQKLSLLKFLIGRAYSTEKFRLLLGKHVSEGINASKEYSRAALQDRKIALEEEKKLREKQRVELAELVEKGKGSVKTWLKNDKKSANGSATDTASVDGDDQDKKAESGAPTPAASASTSDSEMEDLTEEAIVKNEEDLEKLLNDSLISRHEYLSRKKHLEAQREKLRKRTEEKMKKQKALEQLERKRASAKKSIQEGLVSKDPALLRIAIEKGKECDLPDRIIVSSQHVLEILEAEAIREEEAEERKKKFNKTMRDLFVRTEPLGRDKNGLRYWCFREDKCHLYVEKPSNFDIKKHYEGSINSGELDHASWFYYGSKAEVTALIESLDERNLAEASLKNALKENFDMITDDMPSSKPGLLMSDLNDSEGKKRGSKARQSSADVEDPESFLSWKNTKKTWKKKNHLESDVDAFRQDLVDVEMWVSKRLKELGSSWHDTGRPDWVKSVKAMESVTDAIKPVLALENEVMSFQLRAQTLLAGSSTVDRAAKLAPSTANGESASVSDASGKDPDKSDEEDEDDDEDMEEEEAAADDGSMLWPTRKSRDRWIAAVAKARTFATLSAALGSFVQRLDIFGLSEVAMDESTVTTRRAKSEKEKQSRKERAVKKKQKKEAEEAEIEDRHSVDDWEEDCYICTEGGELLCCDGCPRVFHFPCVGLRRVPRGKTFCHYCDPSVKPVYPVMGNRATTRAKVERDDVVATDSVEETGEDDSDEDESDVELAVDAASLNASTAKHSDDQWDVECGVCRLGGELLCCDGCPRAFHTKCIDLKHVPEDEWFCDECNLQTCGSCKKNKIRLDSHVICGSEDGTKGCEQVFHLKCAKLTAVPDDDWYCTKCRKTIQK